LRQKYLSHQNLLCVSSRVLTAEEAGVQENRSGERHSSSNIRTSA